MPNDCLQTTVSQQLHCVPEKNTDHTVLD